AIYGPVLIAHDGLDGPDVQQHAAAVNQGLKHLLHMPADFEQQIAAVLDLIVDQPAALLQPARDRRCGLPALRSGKRHRAIRRGDCGLPSLMSLATDSISSARARTRISSVKFTQRTVPDESRRNSAGREMSCLAGPPATCSRS